MPERRAAAKRSIVKAHAELDRAQMNLDHAHLHMESLAADDRQRSIYSAHAFNNYLMIVGTIVEVLRRNLTPKGEGEAVRLLEVLKRQTNKMLITARAALMAHPETLPHLLSEPASLSEIAEGVCAVYRDMASEKRVRVQCKGLRGHTRDRVLTDRVAASAVLDNLLSNAVKYSQAGTAVSVTTSVRDGEAVCSVIDHGPGITADDQARLFQHGVRLSAQPTAGESSSGHGLAIANDLAKALGGRLVCTSTLGHGSCFAFSLPLAPADAHSGQDGVGRAEGVIAGERRSSSPARPAV
jgi:signal transduction histidine kinase